MGGGGGGGEGQKESYMLLIVLRLNFVPNCRQRHVGVTTCITKWSDKMGSWTTQLATTDNNWTISSSLSYPLFAGEKILCFVQHQAGLNQSGASSYPWIRYLLASFCYSSSMFWLCWPVCTKLKCSLTCLTFCDLTWNNCCTHLKWRYSDQRYNLCILVCLKNIIFWFEDYSSSSMQNTGILIESSLSRRDLFQYCSLLFLFLRMKENWSHCHSGFSIDF